MAQFDRSRLIAELERLGDEGDTDALVAARTVAATMRDWGLGWDAVLRMAPYGDEEPLTAEEPEVPLAPEDLAGDGALVDRLLTMELSDETRLELSEMKSNISAGTFDAMDSRYVRALAKRLGG